MNIHQPSARGMSLVELVLVMAIFSVVVLAVMSLYIPTVKSTTIQTRVTDVQSNLRLAADRMTQDLLMAGFLVANDPIINESATELTIRSRAVVEGVGRVASAANGSTSVTLTLSNADMVDYFPVNSLIRVFNAVNMIELAAYDEANATDAQDHVYTVTAVSGSTITVNHAGVLDGISNAEFVEAIVARVLDDQQPPTQTIRYRVVGGSLERTVNATSQQFLARGVNSITFAYGHSATSGRVNKVDFTLVGQTQAYQGDVKTRQVRSSVTLRNVF
ncbi:MAG: prepilin-type N-terminal cleavage/methylation domain-containing protein [Desulfuromonadales bacterium]|nr:prepilin-type N-terminal cleavage/methylation domain-containing protein [Desulfuromonadales bacterium]